MSGVTAGEAGKAGTNAALFFKRWLTSTLRMGWIVS